MEKHFMRTTFSNYRITPLFLSRILSLVLVVTLISSALLCHKFYNKGLDTGEATYIESLAIEQSKRDVDAFMELQEEKVKETLVKSGYFRDDIKLDYQTQDMAHQACTEIPISIKDPNGNDVDEYALLLAIIKNESGFRNHTVTNSSGTYVGYCAIKASSAISYMRQCNAYDLGYPYDTFKVCLTILNSHMNKYGWEGGLSAYNGAGVKGSPYSRAVTSTYNYYVNLFETQPSTWQGALEETESNAD